MCNKNDLALKELSLFSGMGGGIYGSLILGWETAAYVEKDAYCQSVIKQRIADGWFDDSPIYGDIKEFNKNDAEKYTGKIDVLTGGFPCQPFSVAGKRKGTSDERWLFNEIIKTIEIVQPRRLFFENVPGILSSNAIIKIYQSLDKVGYRAKAPLVLGSDDCGNIHRRKRVWIFADREGESIDDSEFEVAQYSQQQKPEFGDGNLECSATYSASRGCNHRENYREKRQLCETEIRKLSEVQQERPQRVGGFNSDTNVFNPNNWSERTQGFVEQKISKQRTLSRREDIRGLEDIIKRPDIPEPLFCGVDDELPDWKQQLKAIGNGQDPIVMATAWNILESI